MMKQIIVSVFVVMAVIFSSCREAVVFREYKKMDNITWNRFDILEFEVPVEQGDALDFILFLRHHTDFPYDKLYVNITFYAPDGEVRSADYDFDLRDKDGKWLADGMGELWDIEIAIRSEVLMNESGICRVRLENKYPKFDTPGIIEVGLIVKEAENQP